MRGLLSNHGRFARWVPAPRSLGGYAMAVVGKLRDLAPYAVMELVLPGGSLIAVLLWLYRRQKKPAELATLEILSFL
jgi:hypothetical protein